MGDFYRCILCGVTYKSKDNVAHVTGTDHIRLANSCKFRPPRYIFKTAGSETPVTDNTSPRSVGTLWFEYDKYMLEQGDTPDVIFDPSARVFRAEHNDDAPSEPLRDTPDDGDVSLWEASERTEERADIARVEAKNTREQTEVDELERLLEQTRLEQEEADAEQARIQLNYVERLTCAVAAVQHTISPYDDSDYDYDSEDFDESSSD
jgi:hypothetical protein